MSASPEYGLLPFDDDRFLAALGPPAPRVQRSQGAIEALENARLAVEEDPVRLEIESAGRAWSRRVWRAVMLARTPEAAAALLRGEHVPPRLIHRYWLRHFRGRG